ncbi:MAG: tetratricopeptide repeat protein, partial [Ferruginibacter sp.]
MFFKKRYVLLIAIFCFIVSEALSQDQKIADSFAIFYQQNTLKDTAKLELLIDLSFNEIRDSKKSLKYAEELISLSKQMENDKYLRVGYFLKGTKKRLLGELAEALKAYLKSAEIAQRLHLLKAQGESYGAIADSYSEADDHPNAKLFYDTAITILRQSNDSASLAAVLSNAGNEFLKTKNYDSALSLFYESKIIFDKVNY